MSKHPRMIGTTEEALARAESQLGRVLPSSFREWLRLNNGTNLESVEVFPVLDDRDPRKTWDSIVRQCQLWRSYCDDVFPEVSPHFEALLPFASFGTGDYYCFDYSVNGDAGEPVVVHWSHETGETLPRGDSFSDFAVRLESREFEHD